MNEYGQIKSIAVRRVQQAFVSQQSIDQQWQGLNYHGQPNFDAAVEEYENFIQMLKSSGGEVVELQGDDALSLDGLYVRDSLIVSPRGLIKASMGKIEREVEPLINAQELAARGFNIIGEIVAPGKVEGGDLVWLDDKTVLAAIGYRTNQQGLVQLAKILGEGVDVHGFDMPHYKGPSDVFHLMSVLSPVDEKLAVVYLPLMPVRLVQLLEARGFAFIEVPDEEFDSMGCNVLAIGPSHVVMVAGNPITQQRIQEAGCKVEVLQADEISRKGEGGPTCLTRPLVRA